MKHKKSISVLVILIILLSTIACAAGLFWSGEATEKEFQAITGERVKVLGEGLYKNDSLSVASQGKASDFITLFLAIPLMSISLTAAIRGSFRGRLFLSGTLGYFLYTYMSYTFLWTYNRFFIVYVFLMSLSFFAFILCLTGFDIQNMPSMFKKKLPVKILGGFQLFIAFMIGILWLSKIAPSILNDAVPAGLEHYTTLVIQGMDLGFVVPTAALSGILLIKRRPLGYLLSSIIILKGITMLTAISAMIVNMSLNGVEINSIEAVIFPVFNVLAVICLVILIKNTEKKAEAI
ncbi:hypothetical protein OXPF_05660 [Oxobacter pfennigii]|uniref:Uncharacterized protein n=1 Tax=Oxobacter pfennigii TaxID=36849 RepID=A0A0P8WT82_9CLOT|nr:hypothetical protein [Oxobacter pfennigii]KPU45841.1 hypothetical protein OXPF_05660 [Oxobacter pfennigii]